MVPTTVVGQEPHRRVWDKPPDEEKREGRTVVQLEVVRRFGGPQPHGVDRVVPVARHRGVIGHGQHHLARREGRMEASQLRCLLPSLPRAPLLA